MIGNGPSTVRSTSPGSGAGGNASVLPGPSDRDLGVGRAACCDESVGAGEAKVGASPGAADDGRPRANSRTLAGSGSTMPGTAAGRLSVNTGFGGAGEGSVPASHAKVPAVSRRMAPTVA